MDDRDDRKEIWGYLPLLPIRGGRKAAGPDTPPSIGHHFTGSRSDTTLAPGDTVGGSDGGCHGPSATTSRAALAPALASKDETRWYPSRPHIGVWPAGAGHDEHS